MNNPPLREFNKENSLFFGNVAVVMMSLSHVALI